MSAPQGLATFPGVNQLVAASITLGHGITPSSATLTIAPQLAFTTEVGTLSFVYDGLRIDFTDCKVSRSSFERNDRGEIWRLTVYDRRWRWRFGRISGTYNVWRDNFTLARGENGTRNTERTPQQLAALCLDAMGESNYDVSEMPNDTRSSVAWDVEVPAQALAALCDSLGCRVVLQLDGRVAVRRRGIGAPLYALGSLENDATIDPPERPDAICVLGGPSRFQVDFPLEAVGIEQVDGQNNESLKLIDSLSYQPAGGWSRVDLPYFHQVGAQWRELAKKSVFRYYRIQMPVDVPGYDGDDGAKVAKLEQLLPIEDEQVDQVAESGEPVNRPAFVFGVWYPDTGDMTNTSLALAPVAPEGDLGTPGTAYKRRFTIDKTRGLVVFEEPVFRNTHASATGGSGYEVVPGAAQLVLRAACNVRDPASLATESYERTRAIGNPLGGGTRYLKHEEIVRTHVPKYNTSYKTDSVKTNQADIDQMADYYLDAAEQEYQTLAPQTVRFGGLVPIEPDGAIEQVILSVGAGGTTTTVCRHTERTQTTMPYRERRRIEIEQKAQARQQRRQTKPRSDS